MSEKRQRRVAAAKLFEQQNLMPAQTEIPEPAPSFDVMEEAPAAPPAPFPQVQIEK